MSIFRTKKPKAKGVKLEKLIIPRYKTTSVATFIKQGGFTHYTVHLPGKDENHALCGLYRPRRMALTGSADFCKKCLAKEQKG